MTKKLREIKQGEEGTGLLIEHEGYISDSIGENKTICESINENGWNVPNPFILDAVFQKYDIVNANGRVYPKDILVREVEKYQQRIREHRAYAELNHPVESVIDLGRICLEVIELHWEKQTLMGKIRIITSEGFRQTGIISCTGDILANLILSGLKVGLSSRGLGSVENKLGKSFVGKDFELICFDAVSDPSTPNAWICSTGDEEEKYRYVETIENKNSTILSEKISKLEKILTL